MENHATSGSAGEKPDHVYQEPIGHEIRYIMDGLEDFVMELVQQGPEHKTPLASEQSSNSFLDAQIFDLINAILSQWPNNAFIRRFRWLLNPHKMPKRDLDPRWANAESSEDLPDARVQLCFDEDGNLKPVATVALEAEGKVWSVFDGCLEPAVQRSGELLLGEAYTNGKLSTEGEHAFEQSCRYLFRREGVKRHVLFTPVAAWVLTQTDIEQNNVSVSEPFTANSQSPSMKEAIFATTMRALSAAQSRVEGTPDWALDLVKQGRNAAKKRELEAEEQKERRAEKELLIEGKKEEIAKLDDEKAKKEAELQRLEQSDWKTEGRGKYSGGLGGGATALHGSGTLGDDLLHELDDAQPAIAGNSLVRIGRLKGDKVAAKLVSGDAADWVKEEIINEGRKLDALKPLQGRVVPEKVYFGRINGGKDLLLVTKYIDGNRIDNVSVTETVAKSARNALQEIHNKGFVHGDVMPRNIVVTKAGNCVLLDLGRTKLVKTEKDKEKELSALERWLK